MNSEILIYQSENGSTRIDAKLEDETVWLSIEQMSELFNKSRSTINEHILNIYSEGELEKGESVRKIGNSDFSTKPTNYYNLDVIISVGYRVKSQAGTRFRQWATKRLNEYITKGFTMDDERLKGLGGGSYWKELLARIRDIRSSEKALYRQVLDLYATSADYNPKSDESIKFFKIVQNKLHYATHKQTAAELIYSRADADMEFMGLTVFAGDLPVLTEVRIAKNYLTAEELEKLNRLVSGYFDLAEARAMSREPMHMQDHIDSLDRTMQEFGSGVLSGAGKVSHQQAIEKAEGEYRKYQAKTLSGAERAYLEGLKSIEKELKKFK
ncbi:MAG: virulence RhuM family protein [Coriobacteriia bacterium]|nr:virulence RhuM family protein [Coriobacteriia bacterium]